MKTKAQTLILGGGIAGLTCGRTLRDAGLDVLILDKGRKAGGRSATRRSDSQAFDHGAQYFTVRDELFRSQVEDWVQDGTVARWQGRIGTLTNGRVGDTQGTTERWVGVPGMSALGRALASDLDVRTSTRINALEHHALQHGQTWRATAEDGSIFEGERIVISFPAPQAVEILPDDLPLKQEVDAVRMSPCWALMATFETRVDLALDGAFINDSPITWAARNNSKPGRPSAESWVLHASPEWTVEHLNESRENVAELLLQAFQQAAGIGLPPATTWIAHRWGFALASEALNKDYLYDPNAGLGFCGDWCPGARIEGAYLSGLALANAILTKI